MESLCRKAIIRAVAVIPAIVAVLPFCHAAEEEAAAAQEPEPQEGEVREAMLGSRKVKIVREGNEWVLDTNAGSDRSWTNDIVVVHKAEDEFLDFNGEKLNWGQIDEHIDLLLLNAPLKLPPAATSEDVEKVKIATRRQYAYRLASMYVRNALLAQEARKLGITVERGELMEAITNGVKRLSRKNRAAILEKVQVPGSYFYLNQENFLLTRKYRAAMLMDEVEVTPDEVSAAIAEREAVRRKSTAANAILRPKMERWLSEIKAGTKDFAEVAEDESDSAETEVDGTMGEFDREDAEDFLPDDIRAFAFAASTNTISGVMETPTEYHIIKILSRRYDKSADDGSIPEVDGVKAPTSVTLAAIVKEKFEVPDPLTEDEARELVKKRKLGDRLVKAQEAALKAATVKSVYPIRFTSKQDGIKSKLRPPTE